MKSREKESRISIIIFLHYIIDSSRNKWGTQESSLRTQGFAFEQQYILHSPSNIHAYKNSSRKPIR